MTKDLANLGETLRALEDVRKRIEETDRILNQMQPDNSYEEEAFSAFTNVLGRYKTIRHALEKRKKYLEQT